jgi:hypothetical protein
MAGNYCKHIFIFTLCINFCNKKSRFLCKPRKGIATAIIIIAALVMVGCASRPVVGSWDDALLVAEQRLEIERLRNDIADMEHIVRSVTDGVESATARLIDSLGRFGSINELLDAMDEYVRSIEAENRQLRALQRANWRAHDAEGHGPLLGLPGY